jgi:hypothetical protein
MSRKIAIVHNLALTIVRNSLSIVGTPLLIRSIGLTNSLNCYFAATAVISAAFAVLTVPVDIYFSPKTILAINEVGAQDLRRLAEKRIAIALFFFLACFAAAFSFVILAIVANLPLGDLRLYTICALVLVNTLTGYCFLQLLDIKRFEKRVVEASRSMILNTIIVTIVPLAGIDYYGFAGYLFSASILGLAYTLFIFTRENLCFANLLKYRPKKHFLVEYFHLFTITFFSKGFAIAESTAVGILALQDAALYFLAKKIASQILSVVVEGRNKFLQTDLAFGLSCNDSVTVGSILQKSSSQSALIVFVYLSAIAFLATHLKPLSGILKITIYQANSMLVTASILSLWLYASISGTLVSFVFYSLDLAKENRRFLLFSAVAWAAMTVMATYLWGIYGTSTALGFYYLFNNKIILHKIASKQRLAVD